MAAAVEYIDFEGRTDKSSLLKILTAQIQPKQLLLVRGSTHVRDEVLRGLRKVSAAATMSLPHLVCLTQS